MNEETTNIDNVSSDNQEFTEEEENKEIISLKKSNKDSDKGEEWDTDIDEENDF